MTQNIKTSKEGQSMPIMVALALAVAEVAEVSKI
jgi:hypothetical protein